MSSKKQIFFVVGVDLSDGAMFVDDDGTIELAKLGRSAYDVENDEWTTFESDDEINEAERILKEALDC
jgi:hypothetical protein